MNTLAVWPASAPGSEAIHAVVEVREPGMAPQRYTLCQAISPHVLERTPGNFSPRLMHGCPGCVQVWRDSLSAKARLCRECAAPLPADTPINTLGYCTNCQASAAAAASRQAEQARAKREDAARRAAWLMLYQGDIRFPTLFCRADSGHGPAQVGVTDDAEVVVMCACGWNELFPEDVQAVYVACSALGPATLAILGYLLPAPPAEALPA